MKLICKKCGMVFDSLIIDRQLAWKEVYKESESHIKTNHKAMFVEMAKAVTIAANALATAMHIEEFCIIPEEEMTIQATVEKNRDIVMAAIGYDPEEEEEEFEDEDEGIDNDPQVGTVEVIEEEDKTVTSVNS